LTKYAFIFIHYSILLFLLLFSLTLSIILNKNSKFLNDNCTAALLTKKHCLQGNAFVGVKMNFKQRKQPLHCCRWRPNQ